MKIKNTKISLVLALCSLGGMAATNVSQAALTTIQISAVSGTSMSSAAYSGNSTLASSGWAGSWSATILTPGLPNPLGQGAQFVGFCTDIGNSMGNGSYNYEARAFSSALPNSPEGAAPDPNWANSGSGQRAAWIYNTYIGSVVSADTRAAMCIAVWEALYEGSGTFDVANRGAAGAGDDAVGRTFVANGSSTVQGIANGWLTAGVNAGFAGYDYTWFAEREGPNGAGGMEPGRHRDQDVQSLVGPSAPIPEPSTVIAGLLLLVPFGLSTLRMLRKNRVA